MSLSPNLPVETLERILGHAFDIYSPSSPSSPSPLLSPLLHLLLVSKGFSELALPLLYHTITISKPYGSDRSLFFGDENGILVSGDEGRRRARWVKEIKLSMELRPSRAGGAPSHVPFDHQRIKSHIEDITRTHPLAFNLWDSLLEQRNPLVFLSETILLPNLERVVLLLQDSQATPSPPNSGPESALYALLRPYDTLAEEDPDHPTQINLFRAVDRAVERERAIFLQRLLSSSSRTSPEIHLSFTRDPTSMEFAEVHFATPGGDRSQGPVEIEASLAGRATFVLHGDEGFLKLGRGAKKSSQVSSRFMSLRAVWRSARVVFAFPREVRKQVGMDLAESRQREVGSWRERGDGQRWSWVDLEDASEVGFLP